MPDFAAADVDNPLKVETIISTLKRDSQTEAMYQLKTLLLILTILVLVVVPIALSEQEAIQALLRRLDSKRSPASVQEAAAKSVLNRLLPNHVNSFEFKIVTKDICGGSSCFILSNYNLSSQHGAEIMIKGTTGVELASGLHWYLKYWCGAHVSWDKTGGIQIASIPNLGFLPLMKVEGVTVQRPVPWNYYQNVVTSSCK